MTQKFENFYNKNYKKFLIIPATLLILSLIYIAIFYIQNNSIIKKDVSLTGGTTITIFTDTDPSKLKAALAKNFSDFSINSISDNTGKQTQIIITIPGEPEKLKSFLEDYLGYPLTDENSSIQFTGSSLSEDFYKQLIVAVFLAFFWMACIVFVIFAKQIKIKILTIFLNILFGILLGFLFTKLSTISLILLIAIAIFLIYTYIKNSIPSFAVMLSAFADIVMTLALVDFIGMKISTAGIVAFLMLIGYSVDTDILLTTRMLKRKREPNQELWGAFKTGTTMTLTSIVAIATALIIVYPFHSVLNQIFTILLIGLGFDLINTWISNASMIKWYVERK